MAMSVLFFFFSSRRRHTSLQGDWSSDVCSSDLSGGALFAVGAGVSLLTGRSLLYSGTRQVLIGAAAAVVTYLVGHLRSEERRVGKEWRSGGTADQEKIEYDRVGRCGQKVDNGRE